MIIGLDLKNGKWKDNIFYVVSALVRSQFCSFIFGLVLCKSINIILIKI